MLSKVFVRVMFSFVLIASSLSATTSPAYAAPMVTTISGITAPHKVVFTQDNRTAYVLTKQNLFGGQIRSEIYKIDVATGTKTQMRDQTSTSYLSDIDVSPDGQWLYFSPRNSYARVLERINTSTFSIDPNFQLPFVGGDFSEAVNSFDISNDGNTIYALGTAQRFYTINVPASSATSIWRPSSASGTFNAENFAQLSQSDQDFAFFVNRNLTVYNTSTQQFRNVQLAENITSLVWKSAAEIVLFTGYSSSLFDLQAYDLGATGIRSFVALPINASSAAKGDDSRKAYVVNGTEQVRSVNLSTETVEATVVSAGAGKKISRIDSSKDGALLAASDSTNNTVSIISLLTPRTISFDSTTSDLVPYGSSQQLSARVSAGETDGVITYSHGTSTACSVNPSTGLATMTAGVGTCVVSASISAGETYGGASTTTQVTITPSKIPLTIRANSTSKTYDQNPVSPSFTLTAGSLVNSDSLSSVTYNYSGTGSTSYSATTAPSNAGTYTVTPSAAAGSTRLTASNYDITYVGTSFSISKASRSLTFDPVPAASYELAYGDTLDVVAIPSAGVGDGTITYSSSNTSGCSVSSSGRISAVSSSGSCEVSATISVGTNYLDAQTTTSIVVNGTKQIITVKATSPSIFFGTQFTATATVTQGKLYGTQQLDNANMTFYFEGTNGTVYPRTTVKPVNVGNYTITPESIALTDGGQATDYNVNYQSGILTINKTSRSLEFQTHSYSLTYGQTQQLEIASYQGDGDITYSSGSSDACTVDVNTGVVTVTESLGTCAISATISDGTNHLTASSTVPVSISVSKRPITVTATSPSVTFGGTVTPGFTLTSGSLAFSDSISGLTYNFAGAGYASSTTAPTAIGTYSVTPSVAIFSGDALGNYAITYSPGTLSIVAKSSRTLSFTTQSYALGYGETQTVVATSSAAANDGTLTYSAGSSSACSVNSFSGLVTVTASSGSCEISASISEGTTHLGAATSTPVTITVSARVLTISATDLTVEYGGTVTPDHTFTQGDIASSDSISAMTYTFAGVGPTVFAASTTAPSAPGTYSITPSLAVFSSGSANNYVISYAAGNLTISQPLTSSVTITMSASVGSYVTNSSVGYSASGLSSSARYELVLRSTPQTLASGSATLGSLSGTVMMPAGLESGWHTLTFTSTGADGADISKVVYFKISSTGMLLSSSETMPADFIASQLGNTGLKVAPFMGAGFLLIVVGFVMSWLFSRRRNKT